MIVSEDGLDKAVCVVLQSKLITLIASGISTAAVLSIM